VAKSVIIWKRKNATKIKEKANKPQNNGVMYGITDRWTVGKTNSSIDIQNHNAKIVLT
jgi:hypothetical protein